MAESNLNERVEEIVWKIRTLDATELLELKRRLGDEFTLPDQPDELSTREPRRPVPSAGGAAVELEEPKEEVA